jgi:hypothetical protein
MITPTQKLLRESLPGWEELRKVKLLIGQLDSFGH